MRLEFEFFVVSSKKARCLILIEKKIHSKLIGLFLRKDLSLEEARLKLIGSIRCPILYTNQNI